MKKIDEQIAYHYLQIDRLREERLESYHATQNDNCEALKEMVYKLIDSGELINHFDTALEYITDTFKITVYINSWKDSDGDKYFNIDYAVIDDKYSVKILPNDRLIKDFEDFVEPKTIKGYGIFK